MSHAAVRAVGARGAREAQWLERVDDLIESFCADEGITPQEVLAGGTMGAVVQGVDRDGCLVVVKSQPDLEVLRREVEYLHRLDQPGASVVSVSDGVFAMQFVTGRVENGQLGDDAVTLIEPVLAHEQDTLPFAPALDVAELGAMLTERMGRYDQERAQVLEAATNKLEAVLEREVERAACCAHGDLNAANTIMADGRLTVIDPWPRSVPVGFDAAYWACDPLRGTEAAARLAQLEDVAGSSIHRWAVYTAAMHLTYLWHYHTGGDANVATAVFDEVTSTG
jgi:hypothetical protein